MSNTLSLCNLVKEEFEKNYTLTHENIGPDACVSSKGTTLRTECYNTGAGHLCFLSMKAMLGLMKMETVVFTPYDKDVPLINLDMVHFLKKETAIAELYDIQINPYPDSALDEYGRIKLDDSDLTDQVSKGTHWYDDILYPCSYHKTGKGITSRLLTASRKYAESYVRQLGEAECCDPSVKSEKVRDFADKLYASGGPAVDQIVKLFGPEFAERLIKKYMYHSGK